ncbi:hypothetical protein ACFFIZ_08240, partial [Paracoccus rhizosphaerae]
MAVIRTPSILNRERDMPMPETTITQLPDPSGFSADPFTDIIRDGARKLIEQAMYAEFAALMAAFSAEAGEWPIT